METKILRELPPLVSAEATPPAVITPPKTASEESSNQSYYRSKIFSTDMGLNPLVSAASAIFSLGDRLQRSERVQDLSRLHQELIHEIKAFEHLTRNQGHRSQIILAARFVLCAWLDDIILHTKWGQYSEWEKRRLTNNWQHEFNHMDQFFLLLERCLRDPKDYIDLLELMYLCLSLGFIGLEQKKEYGAATIAKIRSDLYHCIMQTRGEVSQQLEIQIQATGSTEKTLHRWLPIAASLVLSFTILTTSFILTNNQLNQQAHSAYQLLNKLLQPFSLSEEL